MSIQIKHKASHTQDNILTADEYNEAHDVVGINPGRIPFGVSGNQLGQDDNLFWDNTNKRLGIGTTSPGFRVDVYGPRMRLRTVTTSEDAYFDVEATSTTREAGINFFKGSSRFTANNHSFHIHMKHDNNLRIFSWDGDTAQYVENILYITRGGNVAIRTASAPNILTIQQNSATDPIADAWLQYSTKETKKIIREVNPHGYLEKFKAVKVYEWKRET
ncbi:MAG: hypothetical protein NZ941_03515, partial [Candidatus Caldarchaeum sp.]|nr:hypothetical protein [Candidatus Caldarchaeum sp.]